MKFLKRFFYSLYFFAVFSFFSNAYFIAGKLGRLKNAKQWREQALHALDTIFWLTRLRVNVCGREHIPEEPVIFCANHQSFLDGLILFYVLRKPFTAITAPNQIFPNNLIKWFQKMGYLAIGRDTFEELHYKEALARTQSVQKAVQRLARGESLLIFPEGKREFARHLLPFHAGVARIAHEARAPVVPIVLHNVDVLFPHGSYLLTPAAIGVTIEKPVHFREHLHPDLLHDTRAIEAIIRKHLPVSYSTLASLPHYLHGKRAAFFDLDGTLTRKNIYQSVVLTYFRKHVSVQSLLLLGHAFMARLTKKHGHFYAAAVRLLSGITVNELLEEAPSLIFANPELIFFSEMLELILLHKKEGNLIFVLSEEPQQLLDPLLHYLDVSGFGTATVLKDGIFTGNISGHIMKDEFKREKVLELARTYGIDLAKSYAYGNSWHDYAMLRTVGHAVLVNPEKSLRKRGKELGFRIIKQS